VRQSTSPIPATHPNWPCCLTARLFLIDPVRYGFAILVSVVTVTMSPPSSHRDRHALLSHVMAASVATSLACWFLSTISIIVSLSDERDLHAAAPPARRVALLQGFAGPRGLLVAVLNGLREDRRGLHVNASDAHQNIRHVRAHSNVSVRLPSALLTTTVDRALALNPMQYRCAWLAASIKPRSSR
jgi:hypothetical protein